MKKLDNEEWVKHMAELEDKAGGFPGVTGGIGRKKYGRTLEQMDKDKEYILKICQLVPYDELKKEVILFLEKYSPGDYPGREDSFESETITAQHEIVRHWINFTELAWRKFEPGITELHLSGAQLLPELPPQEDSTKEWQRRYDHGVKSILNAIALDEPGLNRILELLCSNIIIELNKNSIKIPDYLELFIINNSVVLRERYE